MLFVMFEIEDVLSDAALFYSAGMILTLKDTGVPECVLSGPPQLVRHSIVCRLNISAADVMQHLFT